MSKQKPKVVDLVVGEDGVYGTKQSKNVPAKRSVTKEKSKHKNHADDFLGGIDIGLDFVEKVVPRVERFMRLKG